MAATPSPDPHPTPWLPLCVLGGLLLGAALLWRDARTLVVRHTTALEYLAARQTRSLTLCGEVAPPPRPDTPGPRSH